MARTNQGGPQSQVCDSGRGGGGDPPWGGGGGGGGGGWGETPVFRAPCPPLCFLFWGGPPRGPAQSSGGAGGKKGAWEGASAKTDVSFFRVKNPFPRFFRGVGLGRGGGAFPRHGGEILWVLINNQPKKKPPKRPKGARGEGGVRRGPQGGKQWRRRMKKKKKGGEKRAGTGIGEGKKGGGGGPPRGGPSPGARPGGLSTRLGDRGGGPDKKKFNVRGPKRKGFPHGGGGGTSLRLGRGEKHKGGCAFWHFLLPVDVFSHWCWGNRWELLQGFVRKKGESGFPRRLFRAQKLQSKGVSGGGREVSKRGGVGGFVFRGGFLYFLCFFVFWFGGPPNWLGQGPQGPKCFWGRGGARTVSQFGATSL